MSDEPSIGDPVRTHLDEMHKRDAARHKAIIAADGRKRLKLLRQVSFLLTPPAPALSNEARE